MHLVDGPEHRPFVHPAMHEVFGEVIRQKHCQGEQRNNQCFRRIAVEAPPREITAHQRHVDRRGDTNLGEQKRRNEPSEQTVDQEHFVVRHRGAGKEHLAIKNTRKRLTQRRFAENNQPDHGDQNGQSQVAKKQTFLGVGKIREEPEA